MKSAARLITALFVCISLVTSACGMSGSSDLSREEERDRPKYRFQMDTYRYMRDDGRFGIRNANPNLAIGEWSHPSRKDNPTQRMKRSAMAVKGVEDVQVRIIGGHAALKVIPKQGFPVRQYDELQEKVLRKVSFEMPRFEIRVKVTGNRWNPLFY